MKIDKDVRHYFKLWQEVEQVYQNINIDEFEFKFVSLEKLHIPEKVKIVRNFTAKNFIEISDIDEKTKQYDLSNKIKHKLPDTAKQAPKGTILISRVRPLLGSYTIIKKNDDCFTTGDLNPIVLDEEVNIDYVFSNICSLNFKNFLIENQNTSGQKPTITSKLYNFEVPLPNGKNSSELQAAIVEFLEYYKAKFNHYRKLIDQLKSQVESFDRAFLPAIFSAEKDSFIEEHFDQWSIRKQLSIKFNDINFERSVLKECCSFPPLSRVKGKADLSIQEYKSLGNQEQMQYFPLISGTMLNNQITGYIHKDRLSANSLSPSPVLSWTRINASQFFIQNNPVVTNDDSFILVPNDSEKIKFVYYSILAEMSKSQFSWTNKAGKEKVKNISIYSLSNPYYSSAIVEFIEEWHNWRDEIFRRVDQLSTSIDQAEEALIAKTFKGCEE